MERARVMRLQSSEVVLPVPSRRKHWPVDSLDMPRGFLQEEPARRDVAGRRVEREEAVEHTPAQTPPSAARRVFLDRNPENNQGNSSRRKPLLYSHCTMAVHRMHICQLIPCQDGRNISPNRRPPVNALCPRFQPRTDMVVCGADPKIPYSDSVDTLGAGMWRGCSTDRYAKHNYRPSKISRTDGEPGSLL